MRRQPLIFINRKKSTKKIPVSPGETSLYRNYKVAPAIPNKTALDSMMSLTGLLGFVTVRFKEVNFRSSWVIFTQVGHAVNGQLGFPFTAPTNYRDELKKRTDRIANVYSYRNIKAEFPINLQINSKTNFYVICETNYNTSDGSAKTNGLVPYKFIIETKDYHCTYISSVKTNDDQIFTVRFGNDKDVGETATYNNFKAIEALFKKIMDSTIYQSPYEDPATLSYDKNAILLISNNDDIIPELILDHELIDYRSKVLLPIQEIKI